jgi:hypothetical protein
LSSVGKASPAQELELAERLQCQFISEVGASQNRTSVNLKF